MALSQRTFGLEFEIIVRLTEIYPDIIDLFQAVADHVTDNDAITIGPRHTLYDSYHQYEIPRDHWIIVEDGSLGAEITDFRYSKERVDTPHMKAALWLLYFCGAEIVSPILHEGRWDFVSNLLKSLGTEPCSVFHNTSTSTHIHVGVQVPGEEVCGATAIDTCTKVAAVWFIFETFLNLLHPDHRVNGWCKRSRRSPLARKYKQNEFIEKLTEDKNPKNIYLMMNNTLYTHADGEESLIGDRYFGVSFGNLERDYKYTIEFRSHEGTNDIDAIECWGKLVMRLFDQAAQSDWEYIWSLVYLTDGLSDRNMYGPEPTRLLPEWRQWIQHMHYLFLNYLAGEKMREEYLDCDDIGSLEEAILPLEQLAGDAAANPQLRDKREEELLIKRFALYMKNRRAKFRNLHDRKYFDFMEWDSSDERYPYPDDYVDYPNPSGIVTDEAGRDIPINLSQPTPEEIAAAQRRN